MSSSHQSTTMSLQQAKNNCHKVVNKYLTYFHILQIVSGKGSSSGMSLLLSFLTTFYIQCMSEMYYIMTFPLSIYSLFTVYTIHIFKGRIYNDEKEEKT